MIAEYDDAEEDGSGESVTAEYQEYILNYIENIKSQIAENHDEFEQLYRLKSILEQNVEKLSDSLNVARKQIERQNIKLSTMSKQKSDFENKEKEFELTVRDYQGQIRDFKKINAELETKIVELTTKNSELAQEVSETQTLNANIEQERAQLEKDYFDLNEKFMMIENKLAHKEEEYNQIYEKINIVEQQVQSNEDNTDDILRENVELGQGIIEMEKMLRYMKEATMKFMSFIREDLPPKSIYKILFCLIENKSVKVKEFETLINLSTQKAYSDVKELEKMGLVVVNREASKSYPGYVVELVVVQE